MSSANYRVRRATLDDMGQLTELWALMHLSSEDLTRRVTEFQVAEGPDGRLAGALGLQIAERQGLVHSEAFTDFALADTLRPMLWDRVHAVATNLGLLRLWTHEKAPFWTHCGMVKSDPETLTKLPAAWKSQSQTWLTLKLKDDIQAILSADREFALFMAAEKERTNRSFQQAKVLKFIATLVAVALFITVMVVAFYVVRNSPQFQRH